ncbi:MAG: MBL fold metallo-hydrolase [Bacteroidetes bacterium]|nr:MBL fold metallo-hydrolase [Bacteroidota bacterium]
MTLKRILISLGGLILILALAFILYMYPFYHFFFTVENTVIDKDLTVLSGAGNSGLLVTDSAVVVIDTKMSSMAEKLYMLAREKAGNKKIIVINTHFHGDHVNGNKLYKGCPIYIGGYDNAFLAKQIDAKNRPTMLVKDSLTLLLGNETLTMYNLGQGHTFDDMVVYLQNRKVLFTGDLVFNHINPALFKDGGTNIEKWEAILKMIPNRWEIKTVVPGHGLPGGPNMITEQEKYFEDMQTAASQPDKASEVKARYKEWRDMPTMASTSRTIDFIREK